MILKFFSSLKEPRKLGAFAMHLGALIVLTGGIITAFSAQSGYIQLNKGETKQLFENWRGSIEPLGFSVRLDNFVLRDFRSNISIIEKNGHIIQGILEINHPFKYKGYVFYQSGYNPTRSDWTVLELARDPGVGVVYAGFLLLNIGAVLSALFILRKEATDSSPEGNNVR